MEKRVSFVKRRGTFTSVNKLFLFYAFVNFLVLQMQQFVCKQNFVTKILL